MEIQQRRHDQHQATMLPSTPASIQLRVLAASTGVCYPIDLHPNDLNVATLRKRLAGAVPLDDQILLLGPPYKVPRDSTLRSGEVLASLRLGDEEDGYFQDDVSDAMAKSTSATPRRCSLRTTEKTGARRLFLFSKQALSDSSPDPPPCVLEPVALNLPTEPDPSPVSNLGASSSPLHQALEVYERRFMLNLCRGRALADGADLRIASCQKCVAEQSVMARALRAAVANLSDHRNNATRAMSEFTTDFQSKTAQHNDVLCGFEALLTGLADEKLHPALQNVAKRSGRMVETLLDTVPVERERAWAAQCQTAHSRLLTLFQELDRSYARIGNAAAWEDEARGDMEAEKEIIHLTDEVEDGAMEVRKRQVAKLDQLTNHHGEVVRVIMNAIGGQSVEKSSTQGSAQSAFSVLEDMSHASTDILPSMEADDNTLSELMKKVADAKTRGVKRMRVRLRQISMAQSTIQRVLSSMSVLRDTLAQQCENMVHLEHVAQLKVSYRDFLAEVRRRRAYGGAVSSTMEAMIERMAAMRVDEVKSRERFLRGSGRHLMPAFYEIFAPTLASPPPLFAPQIPATIELDSLPDVGLGDDDILPLAEGTSNITLSSTSDGGQKDMSETTEGGQSGKTGKPSATDGDKTADLAAQSTSHTPIGGEDQEQQGGLIVSAEENSNEIMADNFHEQRVAAEAERKTLVYENTVLRQALERLGGKAPRTYVEEAKLLEEEKRQDEKQKAEESQVIRREKDDLTAKVAELEKKLARTKARTKEAEVALIRAKKKTSADKISHSSFEISDVALFMRTGRAVLGTRIYLAFHSNCPHRYLSSDCVDGTPDYVLGRIIYQEEKVAGEAGSGDNPYGLHPGTKFWVLTVEVLKVPQGKS